MKNPWMSLWLSAANSVSASARGHTMANARRNQQQLIEAMTRQMAAFWAPALQPVPVKRRATRNRTR